MAAPLVSGAGRLTSREKKKFRAYMGDRARGVEGASEPVFTFQLLAGSSLAPEKRLCASIPETRSRLPRQPGSLAFRIVTKDSGIDGPSLDATRMARRSAQQMQPVPKSY